jgi:hypothetical protein
MMTPRRASMSIDASVLIASNAVMPNKGMLPSSTPNSSSPNTEG